MAAFIQNYRFMLERPADLISSLELIMKALGVNLCAIGIEDNKPKAIELLSAKVKYELGLEVVTLKTKYPQGAEKMLLKLLQERKFLLVNYL